MTGDASDDHTDGAAVWLQEVIGSGPPTAAVDCAPRVHLCRAACCHLQVALTRDEVDAGVVRWDADHPYLLARTDTGACSHLDPARGCDVHDDRPVACRAYTCQHDPRIWDDFDAMVPNTAWLDEHVGPSPDA